MSLDQAYAVLVGAIVGASAAIVSSFVTGWRNSQIEKEKWQRAREDSLRSDTRSALADLAKTLAAYAHSMMWATYKAIGAKQFSEEDLQNFEVELHQGIADMVRCQLLLAALDRGLYERVTPIISEAIELGGKTFSDLRNAVKDVDAVRPKLSSCNQEALKLIKRVPNEFANLLRG